MRQLRLGLLLIGGFPASYIQDAILAIPDATQRDSGAPQRRDSLG